MARLDIRITQQDGKTHTTFGKKKDAHKVSFHNDDQNDTLTVTVSDPNALCDGGQPAPQPIVVAPLGSAGYKICANYSGTQFTYTAQIGNSTPEDPIIIMDHHAAPILTPIFLAAAAAFIGGAVLGLFAGMTLAKRRSAPPA
ncbi:MAG: hypothetical protein ACT4O5_12815 [Gammaproteobacteria bacterium]